ncbi:hypothetical protein RKD21_005001 [Streptomyces albogriseolus]|uniref:Uncharacterized protein n=1 Tax=Streptomyces albogriseolus TaxID=1887 RepID=A0ACC6UTE2_STRAO
MRARVWSRSRVPASRSDASTRKLREPRRQPLQLAQAGGLDGQGDAVRGELEAQRLLVGVAAGRLGGDAEGAGEAPLDLQGHGDDRAHAGAVEERDSARHGREVLVDGRHAGGAVAAGAALHGDACEALAGRGQAGGGADLQLGLVVGGEQQEGGVAVEHVAGALHGALQQAVEVVGGGGADEDLERVGALAVGAARGVGGGAPEGGLQNRPFVVAYQETHG